MLPARATICLAALALGVALSACGGSRPGPRGQTGAPVLGPGGRAAEALDFELADARGGGPIRLSDFRGRPVVVHFFTTWCAPCEAEFENFKRLVMAHAARGDLAVLGVSLDLDGKKLLPMFLEVRRLDYPVGLADERMLHGETPFGPVRAIPASFLVDATGRHVESYQGVVPFEHLRSRIERLTAR